MAWPLAAALSASVIAGWSGTAPAVAAESTPPSAVEDFSYPGAAKVLADRGITLKAGDGHIVLADCASGTGLVQLFSRSATPSEVCFQITGPTGYLSLEIPQIYNIKGDDHAIKATLNTAGTVTSLDVPKNTWTPVGEGTSGDQTTLLELNASGGSAAPAGSNPTPAVGTITVGQPGHPGSRSCTATLVAPQWMLTAASCFTDNPADLSTVPSGLPRTSTTATIAGRTLTVVEVAPRTDRDLAMVRVGESVLDVAPIAVATTAPTAGESLQLTGFGRTRTDWVPSSPHSATFTTGTVNATNVTLAPSAPADATVCQGDAGGPALRAKSGGFELAAVTSRAFQGGCLGATDTATGATESRADDLATWIGSLTDRSYQLVNPASGRCLNVSGAGPTWANLTPMILFDCVPGAGNEGFQLTSDGQVRNPASGRCLNVSGAGPTWANLTPMILFDCTPGAANEKFQLTASGQLLNPASGRCLNVSGAGPTWANLTPMILFDCVPGAANETFLLASDSQAAQPAGAILNPASGRCVNVTGAGPTWANSTPIILFDCVQGAGNEGFQLTADGQIRNAASGRCLNVSGAGPTWANLTPIILWDCVPGMGNETFRVTSDGLLLNPASGRCVNVTGAGPTWANLTPIILFDCVPGPGNERFQLAT
ncbi:hypothetical protein GCM10009665_66730 [Kitasatospora nipponensis]|uniref:Peptidase S1 domain-containing protein n=1 Tax=Kitasatospora nipponensis TaxID=258049 RepID=A0ABP4HIP7_9ACTN